FDNGFYVGTWGSSVDFDVADSGSMELDFYAGWGGDLSDSVSVDVGYMLYTYPGTDIDEGYQEVYASISFADFTLGTAISDDYYAETGDFYYVYADYGFEVGDGWGVSLHVGMNEFDEVSFLSDGADSYIDYSVGVSKDYAGVTWGLSYVGTDLDES
ncbi:MAG: TorF family putative porin, partial [Sinobacterium sp.]